MSITYGMYLAKTTKPNNGPKVIQRIFFVGLILIFSLVFFVAQNAFAAQAERLEWEEIPGAFSYDIEIARDQGFEHVIHSESVGQTTFAWKEQQRGTYYWRVRGVDADNIPGDFSDVATVEVVSSPPKKLAVKPVRLPETLHFSWNRVAFATDYELQASDDDSFSKPLVLNTGKVFADIAVPPQMHFWRVRARSSLTKEVGRFSEVEAIDSARPRTQTLEAFRPFPLQHFLNPKDHPVLFSPDDNGVQVSDQIFSYDGSDMNELRIGELSVDLEPIAIMIDNSTKDELVFQWPRAFLSSGRLLLKRGDDVHALQSFPVNIKNTENTNGILKFKSELQEDVRKSIELGEPIRFCVEKASGELKKVLCSPVTSCRLTAQACQRLKQAVGDSTEVRIDGSKAGLSGRVPVKSGEPVTLDIQYPTGTSIHLESRSRSFQIKDVVKQNDVLILSGTGALPFNSRIIEKTGDLGWRTVVSAEKPELYSIGENETLFLTELKVAGPLPGESQRAYIAADSPKGIYGDHVQLVGKFLNPDNQVSSTELRTETLSPTEFSWTFQSEKKSENNVARLNITNASGTGIGSYEIFRANRHELELNLAALYTNAATPIILGELNFTESFENFLFCDRRSWCTQHWGISAGVFGSTSVTNNAGQTINLSGYKLDARYRFTRGVFEHDVSWGLLLGYEGITFSGDNANLLGIGVFLQKPLASGSEVSSEKLSWYRRPKSLDLKFAYYGLPLQSGMSAGPNIDASSKVKLFLSSGFFIDLGLGYRQFNYTQNGQYHIQAADLFMTGGAGWDF